MKRSQRLDLLASPAPLLSGVVQRRGHSDRWQALCGPLLHGPFPSLGVHTRLATGIVAMRGMAGAIEGCEWLDLVASGTPFLLGTIETRRGPNQRRQAACGALPIHALARANGFARTTVIAVAIHRVALGPKGFQGFDDPTPTTPFLLRPIDGRVQARQQPLSLP